MDAALEIQRDNQIIRDYKLKGDSLVRDLNLIKEYRKKLGLALSSATSDILSGQAVHSDSYFKMLAKLTSDINDKYFQPLTKENVMQKLAFVLNIDKEFADFFYDERVENSPRAAEVRSALGQMRNFMQYALLSGPMESGQLAGILDELSGQTATKLVEILGNNFMAYVNPNRLTSADAYYLIGSIAAVREHYKAEWDEFYAKHCEKCGRDDCTTPVTCSTLDEKESKGNIYAKYEEIFALIHKKIIGAEIGDYQINSVLKSLKEGPRKTVLEAFLRDKLPPGQKRINIDLPDWASVDETAVKVKLYKMLSLGHGVDYGCYQDVAIQILLSDLDFSRARGGEVREELQQAYEAARSKVEAVSAGQGKYQVLSELLALFEENQYAKQENKGEE